MIEIVRLQADCFCINLLWNRQDEEVFYCVKLQIVNETKMEVSSRRGLSCSVNNKKQ